VDGSTFIRTEPLRVGVLVDLERHPGAGGHVKCWERLSRAALGFDGSLDLTVHFTGATHAIEPLGANVRYVIEPAVFSTAQIPFLHDAPDHTDLAPWHDRIARALPAYDVVHTTDAYFAYAQTAARVARRAKIPLVNSVHTNTPEYARFYTARFLRRMGLAPLGIDRLVERRFRRRLVRHQRRCAFAFVSRLDELPGAMEATGGRGALLRRGVEKKIFSPQRRDRAQLGVEQASLIVMFAGRLDPGKNIRSLVEAVAATPVNVILVCAGEGPERRFIEERLGPRAILPGHLPPETLASFYASSDVFAFPSEIEEHANVVQEALSSGLPVLVTDSMARAVDSGRTGFVLPGSDPRAWAEALGTLAADPEKRRSMGMAARDFAERYLPSWEDVLTEDLLPRWFEAARR
jgi:glycosyltransferase involved in cell wall biosynthesis